MAADDTRVPIAWEEARPWCLGSSTSKELDLALHLFSRQSLVDQDQAADEVTDRAGGPVAVGHTPMIGGLAGDPEEIRVMRHDDPPSGASKLQMVLIGASA